MLDITSPYRKAGKVVMRLNGKVKVYPEKGCFWVSYKLQHDIKINIIIFLITNPEAPNCLLVLDSPRITDIHTRFSSTSKDFTGYYNLYQCTLRDYTMRTQNTER